MLLPLIAFVDDIILLADSAEMLQCASNIVHKCSRRIRMRLNIGINKSAVMLWGRGRVMREWRNTTFWLGTQWLPRVSTYKYLGVIISAGGGWSHHIAHMSTKAVRKTYEIASWARTHDIALNLTLRLWAIYVYRAFIYGAALTNPSHSVLQPLDRAQRRCGRILLGFGRLAPSPVVLAELGWHRISNCLDMERCSLLMRIVRSSKPVISAVAHAASIQKGSWLQFAAKGISSFLLDGPPASRSEWLELKTRIN